MNKQNNQHINDIQMLIRELYSDSSLVGQMMELRFISPKDVQQGMVRQFVTIHEDINKTIEEVANYVQKYSAYNCYYGVATRTEKKGTTEFCGQKTTLFADYDEYEGQKFKQMPIELKEQMKKQLVESLKAVALVPTIIVDSGNGIHAYWLMKRPIGALQFQREIESVLKFLTTIIPGFPGDTACTKIAQVMRLPGTWNVKDSTNQMMCKALEVNKHNKYDLDEWKSFVGFDHQETSSKPNDKNRPSLYQGFYELNVNYDHFEETIFTHEFFQVLYEYPEKQSYELWFYLASNCSVFGEMGRTVFHKISERYNGYTQEEADRMFDGVLPKIQQGEVGPTKYETIQEAGFHFSQPYKQSTPAGTILSCLDNRGGHQQPSQPITKALELVVSAGDEIGNLRVAEEFIKEHIRPLEESEPIKVAYLKQLLKQLSIPEKGNLASFKKMIKGNHTGDDNENLYIKIADEILAEKSLMNVSEKYYEYQTGVWNEMEEDIKIIIVTKLGNLYSKSTANNILYYLSSTTSVLPPQVNHHKDQHLIPVRNGMLDISSQNFNNVQLLPHQESYYCLNQLDIEFDPQATCPLWEDFLNETFSQLGDEDRRLVIQLLQEFMGYLLIAGNQLQKMMFLIGKPRTGKGIIMSIMNALLGDENVSAIPIGKLHESVNSVILFDKLANIGGEIDEKEEFKAAFVKSLTGEDKILGRALFFNPISFYNEAKLIFSSNHIPRVLDKSEAIYERSLCIPVNQYVPEHKRDPELKNKLKKELSGILNWAIQGRIRLFERGYFIESPSMIELKDQIKEENNSVVYWFNRSKDELSKEKELLTLKKVFDHYKAFCIDEEMKPMIRKNFKKVLSSITDVEVYHPSKPDQDCVKFHWDEDEKVVRKTENQEEPTEKVSEKIAEIVKNSSQEMKKADSKNTGVSELNSEIARDVAGLFKSTSENCVTI